MKRLYSTLILALATGTAFAQQANTPPDAPADPSEARRAVNQAPAERGGVIWSEDFGNGFPAAWSLDDQSGICAWKWTDQGSFGYFNGSNGASSGDSMQSTTAANGYLISDNDSANNVNYGQPSGSTYQYLSTWFTTDAIDCSSAAAVKVEFEQFYRFNNTVDLVLQVSNDSVTWTSYTVQDPAAANNTASANAELASINISTVAGNQPTVYLKFGWDARVYFWMIDDISIVSAPADDLSMNNARFDDYVEYYTYLETQAQPLTFSATVVNEGANAETNVTLDVNVEDINTTTSVFSGSSAPQSFPFLFSDSLTVSNPWDPANAGPGDYQIQYSTSMDATDLAPGNDVQNYDVSVSPEWYARDNGIYQSQYWNGDDGNGNSNAYEYGTMFEFFNAQDVDEISIYVGPGTADGALIYGVVYFIDATGNFVYENQTSDYTVTAADLGTWVTLPIQTISIPAGTDVVVLCGHYGGPDAVYVGRSTVVSPPQTSFLLDGTDNTWYYTTRSPMVRIGKMPSSVNENTLSFELNAYPNPATDVLNIDFKLPAIAEVEISIIDLAGRTVAVHTPGKMGAGSQLENIDISNLANGHYQIQVRAGELISTQTVVVTR